MGWLKRLLDPVETRGGLAEVDFWLRDALVGGVSSKTGAVVNEEAALGHAGVYACVRVLADSVAQLPLRVYRRRDGAGKDEDREHPLWSILHDLPNPEMTAFEFRQAMQGHLALWGNAYAEIERDGFGRVRALWPLRPDRMTVTRDAQKRRVWVYQLPGGEPVKWTWANPSVTPAPILHLRGMSGDGGAGYSPISLLREPIGLGLAAEEYGARMFSNAARPSGVLQAPKVVSDKAMERLRQGWEAAHRGLSNAHRVAILEEGITWQQIGMTANDAQFLETRKFQLNEICRAFRVPPHLVGDLERATFSNIEHQAIDFVVHSLTPWLVCWEQALARDLLSVKGFATHQIRFVVAGLLRGDIATRYEAYSVGRQNGWLNVDEIRDLEDLNPLEDGAGQVYLTPLNMTPAGSTPDPAAPAPSEPDVPAHPEGTADVVA